MSHSPMADSVMPIRVVVCGSMSAITQIEELAASFRSLGHAVVTPSRDERGRKMGHPLTRRAAGSETGPQAAQLELLSICTGCLDGNPFDLPTVAKISVS